jgi:glycerol-3-phosphate cytidylyltransferase
MTLVVTYGTFDLLHVGHVNLLRRARSLGDRLVVGLSSDSFNALKQKQSTQSYADREVVLRAIRYVDDVFPEDTWEQKADDIRRLGADLLVMGSDWSGHFDALSAVCQVRYLPRTADISSSSLKSLIRQSSAAPPSQLGVVAGMRG